MTQREVKHAPGELPACLPCSNASKRIEPRHVVDLRGLRCGGGHFLECSCCDRRTGKHAQLDGAVRDWQRASQVHAAPTWHRGGHGSPGLLPNEVPAILRRGEEC